MDDKETNKNLILFTGSYPYGNGEQFLETEILYLIRRFKELTIVPISIDGPRRHTPDTIKIELSLAQKISLDLNSPKLLKILKLGITAMRSNIFYKEFLVRPKFFTDSRALVRAFLYLNSATNVCKWLLYFIENMNLDLENTIFYTYWFDPTTIGIILAKSQYPNIKSVTRAHGADLYEERHIPPYIPYRQIALNSIDQVHTISEHGQNYLRKRYRRYGRKDLTLSRLGVNNAGFDTAYSKDGIFRIASCSFLVPVKRISLLLKGIKIFSERRSNLPIAWNHLGDGPLRSQLEREARENMPPSVNCHFHGMLANKDVIKFYKNNSVDVFVNVSESEGIPVSIIEAQSCGIPVIATAVGGTSEIVNNENGILLNSNPSPVEIADAFEKFSQGGKDILTKRKCSKFNWYSKYNAQKNYNKFCDDLLTL